jgi:DNA-binding NarL/FixJ family response regulator
MDLRFTLIMDKYKDVLGLLIIGSEVKEHKQLKTLYKITDREAEVIQSVLLGRAGKEIAEMLSITERTVKAHLKNIYDKLGVDNKYHMISLLNEYDLISDKKLEDQIFIKSKLQDFL